MKEFFLLVDILDKETSIHAELQISYRYNWQERFSLSYLQKYCGKWHCTKCRCKRPNNRCSQRNLKLCHVQLCHTVEHIVWEAPVWEIVNWCWLDCRSQLYSVGLKVSGRPMCKPEKLIHQVSSGYRLALMSEKVFFLVKQHLGKNQAFLWGYLLFLV